MKEHKHKRPGRGRKFWACIFFALLFLGILCCICKKLDLIINKVDNIDVCCQPSQITAICVDTLITRTRDTIFQEYYCSQIVVNGIKASNENQLSALTDLGFEVIRSCACDSIRVFGRGTPLTLEEKVRVCESDIVDEGGGLGTGLNFVINLPDSLQLKRRTKGDLGFNTIQILPQPPTPVPCPNKIKVAVIDSGIDFQHEDLSPFRWENDQEKSGNINIDNDKNCYNYDRFGYNFADNSPIINDKNGHGTHVGGIISSITNTPFKVELMDLQVFGKEGADIFSLACALQYAIDKEADIINLSLGYQAPDTSAILDKLFQKTNDAGILVITSAGNKGDDNDATFLNSGKQVFHYPSSFNQMYDNIWAIAATKENPSDGLWIDSNYGEDHVDFAALGEDVLSTYIDPMNEYLQPPYIKLNGTSMAAANVSQIAARKLCSSTIKPLVMRNELILNTSSLPGTKRVTYGVIQ